MFHIPPPFIIGVTTLSGESLKAVTYQINGQPYNQSLISTIEDFVPNMVETHAVKHMSVTGNLGIGVSTPTERLAVKGNIRAQEVKVEITDWPDYVFDQKYILPSLDSVDLYIKEKGHLPGIPSAAEVARNGISLGKMNASLLKKIEELTLYLLEFKEESKQLKAELNSLKKVHLYKTE
jgi:hypothetical protein